MSNRHILSMILALLVMIPISGNGQSKSSKTKDSEQQKVRGFSSFKKGGSDPEVLLDRAESLIDKRPENALVFVEEAMILAIDGRNEVTQARAYYLLGRVNFELNGYELATDNFRKSMDLYKQLDMLDMAYQAQREIGKSLDHADDLEAAKTAYEAFLKEARARNNEADISQTEFLIAGLYTKQGQVQQSKQKYSDLLVKEKQADNKRGVLQISNKLGRLNLEEDSTQEALYYYNQSRDIALELEDEKEVNQSFRNITEVHQKERNLDEVINTQQTALLYNTSGGNIKDLAANNFEIGNALIEKGQGGEALEYLDNTVTLADVNGFLEEKGKAVEAISRAYQVLGNPEEALKRYQEFVTLSEEIHGRKETELLARTERIQELETVQRQVTLLEKDRDLSERTIEALKEDEARQRSISLALAVGLIILLGGTVLLLRTSRQKRVANQLLTLRSLRSQMNPHFIFNALNSVNNFISKSDDRSANKYLTEFSMLMRQVMENSQEDLIPISTELNILNRYVKLEHLRFKDKFDYTINVDEKLDVEAFQVPPMLIQPYIENAVWHGLRYKETSGVLNIDFWQDGDDLLVRVEDNGIGRKRSKELKTANQKMNRSTGMKNINERLKIVNKLYKAKVDVQVTDLDQDQQTGTRVEIRIAKTAAEA